MTPVVVTLPLRLESVANLREHWAKKAKRAKQHRGLVEIAVRVAMGGVVWPLEVTLTRIAPRALDDDNCVACFKSARDGIADALGIDDRDPRVTWKYEQEKPAKGTPKDKKYGLRIELRQASAVEGAAE